jgi:thioredoxin 1
MSQNITVVDDTNFETEVLNSKLPVLVDFSAVWCGPCQRQYPILVKFADDNTERVKVVKIDVDEAPAIAAKFGIRGVPTLMVFNNGESKGSKVGMHSLAEIDNFVMTKTGA